MDVTRFQIYVGHNDQDTKVQKHSSDTYKKILKIVCRGYKVAFSISSVSGGYFHEDGTYVEEDSDVITLIGITEEEAEKIAKDLCAFLNQESVLMTKDIVSFRMIRESLF